MATLVRRNFLWLIRSIVGDAVDRVTIIAYRRGWSTAAPAGTPHTALAARCSLVLSAALPAASAVPAPPPVATAAAAAPGGAPAVPARQTGGDVSELPPGVGHAVGWEANQKGKNGPRLMKLQQFLSPQVRAHALPAPFIRYPTIGCGVLTLPRVPASHQAVSERSVHLNLDLMKWRAIPSLDTGKLRKLK